MSTIAHDAKIQMDEAFSKMQVSYAPAVVFLTEKLTKLIDGMAALKSAASNMRWSDIINAADAAGQPGTNVSAGAAGSDISTVSISPQKFKAPGSEAQPKPNWTDKSTAEKAAAQARQIANEVAQAYEQGDLKHIQSEQQTNAFLLQMGAQSLDEWMAQANELENQRYAIALKGVQQRIKADAGNKVALAKDYAEEAQLYQEHADKLVEIDQQWEEKRNQQNEKATQDFIKSKDDELAQEIDALQREYQAGQISAAQKFATEQALTRQIEAEDIERLRAMQDGLDKQSDAYKAYAQQIQDIQKKMDQQLTKQQTDQVNAMKQSWSPVLQGFDQMVDGIFQGNETLGQIVERAAITMAEDYIKQQIRQLEETVFTEASKSAAVETGTQTRVAAQEAGAKEGSAVQAAAGSISIGNDAKTAASGAYSALAGIPVIGPALGAAAAVAAFAGVIAYDSLASFDVGTPMVPRSGPAMIHAGEMIVPQTFAAGIRSGALTLGGGQGGQQGGSGSPPVHVHINTMDATSFLQNITSIRREISGIVADTWNSNPSLRPTNR